MHLSNRTFFFPCAVVVRAADIDDSAQGQVSRSWAGVEWKSESKPEPEPEQLERLSTRHTLPRRGAVKSTENVTGYPAAATAPAPAPAARPVISLPPLLSLVITPPACK